MSAIEGIALNLNPLIVFLALAFWTWLGPDWCVSRYTDSDHWIGGIEALSFRGRERG